MKKLVAIAVVLITAFCLTAAYAAVKLVPVGTKVSAVVEDNIATVTITGVTPAEVEFYSYEKVVKLGPVNTFKIDLREGRRFNFKFAENGKSFYALLTPEMISDEIDFVGSNIVIDCSNPKEKGCCFKIVKQ